MNILVVDDEQLIREVIKEYLLVEGYNIIEAIDGKDVYLSQCPWIILSKNLQS